MISGRFEQEHIHVCPLHMEQLEQALTTLSAPFQEVSRGEEACDVSWALEGLQERCASLQF